MKKTKEDKIDMVNTRTSWNIILWIAFLTIMLIHGNLMIFAETLGDLLPGLFWLLLIAEISAVCVAVWQKWRKRHIAVNGIWMLPWIFVLIVYHPLAVTRGAGFWVNSLIEQWNTLHEGGLLLLPVSASESDVVAFCFFMAVLTGQISWWFVSDRKVKSCLLLICFWFAVQLFTGRLESIGAGVLLGVLLGLYISGSHMHLTRRGFVWTMTASLCLCLLGIPNADLSGVSQFRETIKAAVHDFRYGKESLPEGNLYLADTLHEGDQAILTVTSQQEKDLYLRAFVGGNLSDGKWKVLSDAYYGGNNSGMLRWLADRDFSPVSQSATYYGLEKSSYTPQDNEIEIRVEDGARDYVYEPYGVKSYEERKMHLRRDIRLKPYGLFGQKNYTFTEVSDSKPAELLVPDSWLSDPESKKQENYVSAEEVYRRFVYDAYLQVDPTDEALIEEIFWKDYEDETDGIYSAVDHIRTVMKENFTYDASMEKIPEGTEPVYYFLDESRFGNDMLYATAAVEALRVHGIPARYVEGYYVSADAWGQSTTGAVDVTDQDAHAWAEVYFDGVGWEPIDVTPGYYYEAMTLQQMVSAPDTVRKTAAVDPGDANQEQILDSGTFDAALLEDAINKAVSTTKTVLGFLGIVLMVLVFIYLLFELFRIFCVARLQYRYYKAGDKRKVRQMGYYIFYYLRLWGIDTNLGWNTVEVDAAVTARFSDVETGEYQRICHLLEKTFYGDRILEAYECHTLQAFLEKISMGKGIKDWKMWLKLRYAPIGYVCKN